MNTEWYKYFIVVAETLNLHKASEILHITPQALSKAISNLENYYNIKLLERTNTIKKLTPEGEFLLNKSKVLINNIDNLHKQMEELRTSEPQGILTIACDSMCQNYYLPDIISKLLKKYNKIIPKIHTMIPDDIEKNVLSGDISIGILTHKTKKNDLGSIKSISTESVIVGKSKKETNWKNLNFIAPRLFKRETENTLDGWDDKIYPRKIIIEVESLEAAIRLCQKGLGAAFLPKLAIEEKLIKKELSIIAKSPFTYSETLYAVYRKNIRLSPSLKAFLNLIKEDNQLT